MLKSGWLLPIILACLASAYGQQPSLTANPNAPAEKPKVTTPAKPKQDDAAEMLQQAYYLGGQLPVDEHVYQLGTVISAASRMRHPMLSQWIQELIQLAEGLPFGE